MITAGVEETVQAGRALAAQLRAGDVVLLRGDLGAGKTAFSRGVAQGLGVGETVTSPTFMLLNCYEGHLPLHHFDLYRLADEEEFYAAGLIDYVGKSAISLIEWPERCEGALPACHLNIEIAYGPNENEREILLTPMGGFREVAL